MNESHRFSYFIARLRKPHDKKTTFRRLEMIDFLNEQLVFRGEDTIANGKVHGGFLNTATRQVHMQLSLSVQGLSNSRFTPR